MNPILIPRGQVTGKPYASPAFHLKPLADEEKRVHKENSGSHHRMRPGRTSQAHQCQGAIFLCRPAGTQRGSLPQADSRRPAVFR